IDENPRPILDLAGRQPDLFPLPLCRQENAFAIPGKPVVRLVAETHIARTIGRVAGASGIVLRHPLPFPGSRRNELLPASAVLFCCVTTELFALVARVGAEMPAADEIKICGGRW